MVKQLKKLIITLTLLLAGVQTSQAAIAKFSDLVEVNNQFNAFAYASDMQAFGVEDRWLTPYELVSSGRGDCEDFAIAKYFALKAKGFDPQGLGIAYVLMGDHAQPHMVLIASIEGHSYVLDNASTLVLPLEERFDLQVVYQFNEDRISIPRAGALLDAGSAKKIAPWNQLVQRMRTETAVAAL